MNDKKKHTISIHNHSVKNSQIPHIGIHSDVSKRTSPFVIEMAESTH